MSWLGDATRETSCVAHGAGSRCEAAYSKERIWEEEIEDAEIMREVVSLVGRRVSMSLRHNVVTVDLVLQ